MSSANYSTTTTTTGVNHRRPYRKVQSPCSSSSNLTTTTNNNNEHTAMDSKTTAMDNIGRDVITEERMEQGRPILNTPHVVNSPTNNGKRTIAVGVPSSAAATTGKMGAKMTTATTPAKVNGDEEAGVIVFEKEEQDDDDDDEHDALFDNIDINDSTDKEEEEEEYDDVDADLDRLLGESSHSSPSKSKKQSKQPNCCVKHCCTPAPYFIGDTTVLCPTLYSHTGLGVVGPHWFGTIFTFGLLWGASYFYIKKACNDDLGYVTLITCGFFTVWSTVSLIRVAFKDPGVITRERQAGIENEGRDLSDWRYCDICSVYQPPDAAHCPDCNVCVEGYDHHCPWMGTCIGKRNMSAFITFNFSWLIWLIYAIFWITIVGPQVMKDHHGKAEAMANETDVVNLYNDTTNSTEDVVWTNSSSYDG